MSYKSMYDHYEVKGGYFDTPSYFDVYADALKEYMRRVEFTRNGFNSEVILSGWDVRLQAFVTIQWVIIP